MIASLRSKFDASVTTRTGLHLFALLLSGTMCFGGGTDSAAAQDVGKTVRIITLGDSITKGVRPGVKAEETFPFLLQEGLKKQGITVEVINVGIGGENTTQALKRLKAQVIDKKPHIVTIMYAANDSYVDKGKTVPRLTEAEYRANLKQIVEDLRKANIKPILMATNRLGDKHPNNGAGEHPGKWLDQYVAICREVAKELNVPLVDHHEHWSKALKGGTDIDKWMTDSCHPNPKGQEEMAKVMLPVVMKAIRGK